MVETKVEINLEKVAGRAVINQVFGVGKLAKPTSGEAEPNRERALRV